MISTSNYLSNLNRDQLGTQFSKNPLDRVGRFIHNHPTALKVIQIAAMIIGAALVATCFLMPPAIGFVAGIFGFITLAAGALTFKYSHFLTSRHDMATHVFTPGRLNDCELRYCKDIPIFTIGANTSSRSAGVAHGLLMAPQIQAIRKNFNHILHDLGRRPRPEDLKTIIDETRQRIPNDYLDELRGLVVGFNQWAQSDLSIPLLTEDEMILFHMIPDSVHFKPMREKPAESAVQPNPAPPQNQPVPAPKVGCTAIAVKGLLGRNLDWPTMGIAGTNSIVFVRKRAGQPPIVEVGFAGFIGTLTGMKGRLRLAMNICNGETTRVEGLPAAFLNRQCLEQCNTVNEVQAHLTANRSLGPYHITAVDHDQAKAFHLLQDNLAQGPVIREHIGEERPLVVTNCRYKAVGEPDSHRSCSLERETVLREFFIDAYAKTNDRNLEELIPFALSLPFVDNWESAHRIILGDDGSVSVSFDNGFAGSAPLHKLTEQELLGG